MYVDTRTNGVVTHLVGKIDLDKKEVLDLLNTIRMLKEAYIQGGVLQILKIIFCYNCHFDNSQS